jgi:hypothetical protein
MTLTEQHLNQLDAFIQEMPTKYGIQLIKFFNEIEAQEKQQQEENLEKENQEELSKK